jgi:hypothetical protein
MENKWIFYTYCVSGEYPFFCFYLRDTKFWSSLAVGLCCAWCIYTLLCWCWCPKIWTRFINWINLSRFHLKMETESSLQNLYALNKNRTMDNVQKCNSCINTQSSHLSEFFLTVIQLILHIHPSKLMRLSKWDSNNSVGSFSGASCLKHQLERAGYHDKFFWFTLFPPGKCWDSTLIKPWPLPSKFFPLNHSSVVTI